MRSQRQILLTLRLPMALALALSSSASRISAEEAQTKPAVENAPSDAPAKTAVHREPSHRRKATKRFADGRITTDGSALATAVAEAITKDATMVELNALHLKISAQGRMVALAGTAGTLHDRAEAARVAEGQKGVTGIRPSISIKSSAAIDPVAVEAAVKAAVQAANVMGSSFAAQVAADGTVQLNGEVTHEWAALEAVRRVPGVTAIGGYDSRRSGKAPPAATASLSLVAPSGAQDAVVKAGVEESLKGTGVDGVAVMVEKGQVRLTGRLGSYAQAMHAGRAASMTSGVLGVDNKLSVPGRVFRAGDERDAASVTADVRRALGRISGQRVDGLGVVVTGTTVHISGRTRTEGAAYAAMEAAAGVSGVAEVVSALTYPTHTLGGSSH